MIVTFLRKFDVALAFEYKCTMSIQHRSEFKLALDMTDGKIIRNCGASFIDISST